MTRPIQARIDERAKRTFTAKLPDAWLPREQTPDYRIDYTVEVFDGDDSSGLFWHVQLKGIEKPTRLKSKPVISFPFETEHLAYFLDKVPLPVFLVVVDTVQAEAWWVFMQQVGNEGLKDGWRSKEKVNVHLPVENRLDDTNRLRKAIVDATRYMRELHPSSVTAAINAEKERIESLDPRIGVTVEASETGLAYHLKPTEPIELKLHLSGESAVNKGKQIFAEGGGADFEAGEVELSGLPKEIREEWGVARIETGYRGKTNLRMEACVGDNVRAWLDLPGNVRSGRERTCIEHQIGEGLVKIGLTLSEHESQGPVDLSVDLSSWKGNDVRRLPHLSSMAPFFRAVQASEFVESGSVIKLGWDVNGIRELDATTDGAFGEILRSYAPKIEALALASETAKACNIEAREPENFGPPHEHPIRVAHGLASVGTYSFPSPNHVSRHIVTTDEFDKVRSSFERGPQPMTATTDAPYPFLDRTISFGVTTTEFSELILHEEETETLDDGRFRLCLRATPNCVATISIVTDAAVRFRSPSASA